MSTVRIGIIGAGGIFRSRHLPGLAKLDNAEVVAICNRSEESGKKIADEFGLSPDIMTDSDALLARDDIDAVMIGTWPYKHCPFVLAALDAGKHTFVQARMAMNLAEAKQMYAKGQETGLVTQICPAPPWKAAKFLRRLIDEGYCGDIYNVYVRNIGDSLVDPDDPLHWRMVDRYSGLNALGMGITMEKVHRILGYFCAITARTGTFTKERPMADGSGFGPVERPETVHILGQTANGAEGAFLFTNKARFGVGNTMEIYGSEGTLIYDLGSTVKGGTAGDDELQELLIPEDEVDEWTVEADFVNAINGGPQGDTSFYEGVRYMELTEAVARSMELGQTINFPLV
ncbi:TPA: gfo/Idh/MocA family oxidoreductase [Candidatus Latescibacteria bacterium]|nr:gfo/Idh/MocA family oxidoreductase [Candidatus Latescibacterota bacterium]|tara:strand:+ start:242 stop:1273 length:1032 start_codon:yes stop_codon:yes gene_type:complete